MYSHQIATFAQADCLFNSLRIAHRFRRNYSSLTQIYLCYPLKRYSFTNFENQSSLRSTACQNFWNILLEKVLFLEYWLTLLIYSDYTFFQVFQHRYEYLMAINLSFSLSFHPSYLNFHYYLNECVLLDKFHLSQKIFENLSIPGFTSLKLTQT